MRPGHIIILGTVLVGLAAVAAVYTPSWKSTDDGAFRILPLLASMNIDRMGPPSWDGRFVPYRNNKAELMLYNVATKESHRVLDHPASERQGILQFIASPDGSRIAYQLESLDGPGQLRIVNADGSGDRLLFTDPKYATIKPTSWSQDGQSIAAILTEKDDASSVGVIKVSDGSLRVLRRSSRLTNAMFSANSRFIAYTEARDIFVIPSAGGAPVGVVVHPANDNLLGWAPDGRLAFTSDRSGKNDIWAVEFHEGKPAQAPQVLSEDFNLTPLGITATGDLVYDRSEMENQLSTAELDAAGRLVAPPTNLGGGRYEEKNSAPDYSRDGNFLAYVSGMKGSQQVGIRIRTLATGAERLLALPMPRVDQIRWYPDGHAILIRGGGSNHYGFFRLDLDKVLKQDPKNPEEPSPVLTEGVPNYAAANMTFSPDGKYLYYYTLPSQDAAALMRLELATGTIKEVLRPKQGFLRMFSISPDGKQIAFDVRPTGTSRDQVFVAPLAGGPPKLVHEADSVRGFGGLKWTDNKTLLFHHPDPYGVRLDDLVLVPLDGGPVQKLASTGTLMRIAVHPDGHHITWESQDWEDKLLAIHNLFIQNRQTKP